MVLELADGPKRRSKYITVESYKRKSTVAGHRRRRPLNSGDNHIYVPAHLYDGMRSVWVREDKFDGLSDSEWEYAMDELLEYQPGMADLSGKAKRKAKQAAKAEKKAKRNARKEKNKSDKNERKNKRRDGIDYKRRSKGDAKKTRADAAETRANRKRGGGGGSDDDDDDSSSSTGRGIFANIVAKGKNLLNKVKGAPAPEGGEEPDDDATESQNKHEFDATFDLFGMQVPKMAVYVGGAALVAGGIYLATREKK